MKPSTAILIACASIPLLAVLFPMPAGYAQNGLPPLQCPQPTGTAGMIYSSGVTVTPPGTAGVAYVITSGSLNDLKLSPTSGQISGLPAAPETLTFTIQANYGPESVPLASNSCTIKISAPPIVPPACPASTAQVGSNYSQQIAASGGGGGFSYTAAGLPPGITLSPAGTLSGSPTTPGSYTYEIATTDAFNQTVRNQCTITVAAQPLVTSCSLPQTAIVGTPLTGSIGATGGTMPYAFTVTSAPAGFTVNPTTGAVTGTPILSEIGPNTISGIVTDKYQMTAPFSCAVPVHSQPITIACNAVPPAIVGSPFTGSVTIGGGSQIYNVSVSGPPWLTINNTGAISGIPTAAGSAANNFAISYTVSVTDVAPAGFQQSQTQSCSVEVVSQLSATCNLPSAAADSPVTGTVTPSGGLPPYTFTVPSGFPGWNVDPNGTVTAPASVTNSVGTFSIPVTVMDALKQTTQASCSLNVTFTPSLSLTGLPSPTNNQTSVSIGLTQTAPINASVSGTLNLSFQPAGPSVDASCVPWATFAQNQLPTLPFTIDSGQTTTPSLENIMLITPGVAGTVTTTVSDLSVGGTPVTGVTVPPVTLTIPTSAPSITPGSLLLTRGGTTLVLQFNGISNTRDLQSAMVTFNPASGASLSGSNSFTIPLTGQAGQYFTSPNSCYQGGAFGVTLSFNVSGDPTAIGSATVTVTNSVGASAPQTTQ